MIRGERERERERERAREEKGLIALLRTPGRIERCWMLQLRTLLDIWILDLPPLSFPAVQ